MKSRLKEFPRTCWLVLSDVPGWADAPFPVRLRRALPVLVPCVGIVLLLLWSLAWQTPRYRAERVAFQPLLALESEVSALQMANSEQQTVELAERAAAASRLLLDSPAALPARLELLQQQALEAGWNATFQPMDYTAETVPEEAKLMYLPVRAKLSPAAGNASVYPSLITLLDRIGASDKRADLLRLAISGDERRWETVELSFRLACPAIHEKIAQ